MPCTVCASRGLSECVLLYGIENTEPRNVFSLISERNGKRIIVDNSKSIEWTKLFVGRPDRDLHIVHVVNDPRGRWASLRRRKWGQTVEDSLAAWCAENRDIRDFAAEYQLPTTVVSYDIIAANQRREIPELFTSLGSRFEPAALRYWEVDHHGFAANGASSALIEHQKFTSPPKHFATADDSFYQNMFGQTFVDERWRTELPEAEIAAITTNPEVKTLLTSLGLRLTQLGMERLKVEGTAFPSVRPSSWMPRVRRAIGL